MKALNLFAVTVFLTLMITSHAFAVGEVFQIETSGTEYCGDFLSGKFNAKNNIDLWVYLESEENIVISFTHDLQAGTTFPMDLSVNLVNDKSTSFIGMENFDNDSFITIQGTTTLDKSGNVKKLKGTFIQKGVLNPSCFSSGTFSSSKKLASLLPCTYTYGDWEPCQPNGTQTRPLISSSPAGCIGTPVLSQTCVYVPPAPSKTWTVYPTIYVNGFPGYTVTFTVTLTTDPINRNIHITITNTSSHSYQLYLRVFELSQGTNILYDYQENLSFTGTYGDWLVVPPGQTRDGYIIGIPLWFNFNEGFTFAFDYNNVFYLEP